MTLISAPTPASSPTVDFIYGTCVDLSNKLGNLSSVDKLGFYSLSAVSLKLKIIKRVSAGTYDVINTYPMSHTGSGWEELPITPYSVPGTGDYYLGYYYDTATQVQYNEGVHRAFLYPLDNSEVTGSGTSGFTENYGKIAALRHNNSLSIDGTPFYHSADMKLIGWGGTGGQFALCTHLQNGNSHHIVHTLDLSQGEGIEVGDWLDINGVFEVTCDYEHEQMIGWFLVVSENPTDTIGSIIISPNVAQNVDPYIHHMVCASHCRYQVENVDYKYLHLVGLTDTSYTSPTPPPIVVEPRDRNIGNQHYSNLNYFQYRGNVV